MPTASPLDPKPILVLETWSASCRSALPLVARPCHDFVSHAMHGMPKLQTELAREKQHSFAVFAAASDDSNTSLRPPLPKS